MSYSRRRAGIAILIAFLLVCTLFPAFSARGPAAATVVSADGWAWRNPVPREGYIYDIWGSSDNCVYVVGEDGMILRYNGNSWVALSSGTTNRLNCVWGRSANDIYAVGDGGTILHYSGAGLNWTSVDSGITEDLYAVWGSSATDIFAVGGNGTIRHYNGSAWDTMVSGITSTLGGVWGSSSSDVYAVASSGEILHYGGVGLSWTSMINNTPSSLEDVWGTSAGNVYAVGSSGTVLHYNGVGSTWIVQTTNVEPNHLFGVWGSSATDVYAVGSYGTILHSSDGSTWNAASHPPSGTQEYLQGIWGSSAANIFTAGGRAILRSTNGTSWNPLSSSATTKDINGVWATCGYIYAVGASGTILRSTDGRTWATVTSNTTNDLYSVWGRDCSNIYAVGAGGTILRSADSGDSWTPLTSGTSVTLYGIWARWSNSTIYAVGAGGTILLSTNNGDTWTPMTSNTTYDLRGVWGVLQSTTLHVYAVGANGTIRHSTGGGPWNTEASGTTWTLNAVCGGSWSNIYAVGDVGTILHSDGSTTWTTMTSNTYHSLRSVCFPSGQPYAVGTGGAIVHYDGSSWAVQASGTTRTLNGVHGSSIYNVYAVGDQGVILRGIEQPSVDSVNPFQATQGQSLVVTITGYYLDSAVALDFGPGITVNSFTVVDPTRIDANISMALDAAPSPPLRDVSVISSAGTATKTACFEVLPLPVVTFVSPAQGARGQTVSVTITGSHFTTASAVTFGAGVTVNSFSATSDTQITAGITIATDASPGARNVSVTTGTGTGTGVGAFTVVAPPMIASLSPVQGARGQTISVTVSGTYFTGATAVTFGAGITVDNFTPASDARITAGITIAADAALGARDLSVTNAAGTGVKTGGFTVVEPSSITAVSPTQGAQGQTITVTITGSRLTGATAVSFGSGITVNTLNVASDTQITAGITIAADAALGARDVSVTTPGGSFTKAPAFTVLPVPAITSISPTQAAQGQTITVTINGTYFTGATAVGFGAGTTMNSVAVVSDTQLTASITIAADATVGAKDVSVTTANGTGSKAGAFKVLQKPVIAISGGSLVETGDRSPSFEGTITDPEGLVAAVQYCVDDSPSWLDGGFARDANDPGKGSYSFTTSLSPGGHRVQIRAVDAAGNVVGSVTDISVSVKKGGSKVWVIVVIAVVVVAIAGAGGYLIWRFRGKIQGKAKEKVEASKQKLEQ